jgi:hypothetical protein
VGYSISDDVVSGPSKNWFHKSRYFAWVVLSISCNNYNYVSATVQSLSVSCLNRRAYTVGATGRNVRGSISFTLFRGLVGAVVINHDDIVHEIARD